MRKRHPEGGLMGLGTSPVSTMRFFPDLSREIFGSADSSAYVYGHDGKDFNAEAVIFSIKRNANTRMSLNTRSKFFSSVKIEGKALDNYTVEIKSKNFNPFCRP
jgi:hypothetical protein